MRSRSHQDGSTPVHRPMGAAKVSLPERWSGTRGGVPSAVIVLMILTVWIMASVLTPACELVPDCMPVWLGPGLPGDSPHNAA